MVPCQLFEPGGVLDELRRTSLFAFLNRYRSVRWLLELMPHISQSLLILAMSFERFIFVCKAASAKQILSKKNRLVAYPILVLVILLSALFVLTDFLVHEAKQQVYFYTYTPGTNRA